jgi:hypothetical protein
MNIVDEIWKDVLGYEGLYQVSNLGQVRSCDRMVKSKNGYRIAKGRILKLSMRNKYLSTGICNLGKKITCDVHVLVAEAFLGARPSKHNVNHLNGVKTDNRLDNLEICSASQNTLHAFKMGLAKSGENHFEAKLTNSQVLEIRELLKQGKSGKELTLLFGVNKVCISRIKSNKIYKLV